MTKPNNLNDIARALAKRFAAGPPHASFPQSLHVLPVPLAVPLPLPLHKSLPAHLQPLIPTSTTNHVLTIAISLAARPVAHLELIFPSSPSSFPPDLILTSIPHDPRLQVSLDLVKPQLLAWHPDKAVDLIDAMARAVQAHLRAYHRASVERLVAGHNDRVAFDLATAATAVAIDGDIDAVYFPPASSASTSSPPSNALAATAPRAPFDMNRNGSDEFASVSLLLPLSIPLDPATVASLSPPPSSSSSPTNAIGSCISTHLPVAVLVDHLFPPHAPATLADVRVSHWLPEPWVARLADTAVKFPTYAYQSAPLVDYLASVAQVVGKAVKVVASSGAARKDIVSKLARAFAECLIEADTQTYSTLAVLIDPSPSSSSSASDTHPVLATLVFPDRFPADPPVLILRAPTLSTAASTPTSSTSSGSSSGSPAPASPVTVARSVPEYTTRPKMWSVLRGGANAELVGRLKGWVVEEAGGWMARVGGK
ncbi:hypothetical protein BCR44DRAFT_51352 [Catenaria anguillulae PL171]|uniref:BRISC and BRCA1-A complex member 2 n=1 Tax=Catenaria anguillulae PL171 TaxID=765915 RepID=A0A1Y2HVE6_9FUNG|nr:hypothetical protein BCR44DRAFT_51352 [Catenaria anguillulae PL171]